MFFSRNHDGASDGAQGPLRVRGDVDGVHGVRVLLDDLGRAGLGAADRAATAAAGVRRPFGAVFGLWLVGENRGRREPGGGQNALQRYAR